MSEFDEEPKASTEEQQERRYITSAIVRSHSGRFAAGYSGNPGGLRGLPSDIKDQLEAGVPKAVGKLINLINSQDDRVALAAADTLLSRLYGKPSVAVDTTVSGLSGQTHIEALKFLAERPRKTE